MRLRLLMLTAAGCLVAFTVGVLAWGTIRAAGEPRSVVGAHAPDVTLATADGHRFRLASLQGHPVVVNFWASWCGPCHDEQPALNYAASRHPGSYFLGVDIKDSEPAARAFVADERVGYPTGPAPGAAEAFGVSSPPETFFINSRGVVVARYLGRIDDATLALYMTRIT